MNQVGEIPQLNQEAPDQDIKLKVIPKTRKLCEAATKMIRPVYIEEKAPPKPQRDLSPTGDKQASHNRPAPRPKPETGDDDLSLFVCSLISDLHARGLVNY